MKDMIDRGDVVLKRIDTKKNLADGFTKAPPFDAFETFGSAIGVEGL